MNRSIPFALLLALSGCAGPLESTITRGIETRAYPAGLTVIYDDRTPLFGGDRIEVDPDGAVRWWTDVPATIQSSAHPEDTLDDQADVPERPAREPEVVGRVEDDARLRLLRIVESIEPWSRWPADDDEDTRLERRRAHLRIVHRGRNHDAWQWADPTETGRNRITAIREWATAAIVRPARPPEAPPPEEGPNPMLTNE